jgi:hypothetical protein
MSAIINSPVFAAEDDVQNMSDVLFNQYPEYGDPLFYNICYTVKHATTQNVLTFTCQEFYQMLVTYKKQLDEFYTCIEHKHNLKPIDKCPNCILFSKFTSSFNVVTQFYMMTFPPPSIWAQKM